MTHENTDYISVLRAKGHRVTPQRLIVLDAICELSAHATIADIQAKVYDLDPTIDRSTIYRALSVLTEVGLIVEAEMGDQGAVYTIAGESHHHHLICRACGKVITIDQDALIPAVKNIRERYNFHIQPDHLTLKGLCESCLAAEPD